MSSTCKSLLVSSQIKKLYITCLPLSTTRSTNIYHPNSGNNSSSDGEELTTSAPCGARRTLFRNKSIEKFHRFKPWEERSSSYSSSVKGGKESRIAYIISISNHMQFGNKELRSFISFLCACPLFFYFSLNFLPLFSPKHQISFSRPLSQFLIIP